MENKAKQVVEYYLLCNNLKNIIRTGWLNWNVNEERVESIAEHIFGVQMLALAMYNTYEYDIDILKVCLMLAIHETEEIIIGDKTMFEVTAEEKAKEGHEAIHRIFNEVLSAPALEQLILEFDERKTKEADFAYHCDKLECDIQAKIYGDRKSVDLNNQDNNPTSKDPRVTKWFDQGLDFGQMWLKFGQERYGYDENFTDVSDYALSHNLSK